MSSVGTATERPILLTGATGQVGGELRSVLGAFGRVVAPSRTELDLADVAAVRAFVQRVRPRWILNPGAYTAVDKAETDAATAYAINRDAVEALGQEAAAMGSVVLHFSTDYVFSGQGTAPWREEDPTGPLGVYGASKLAGEKALLATGAAHLIFRTSWVYGARGRNFLLTMLRLADEREELRIVDDQYGAPTSSRELARLVAHVMTQFEATAAAKDLELAQIVQPIAGVYHACAAGETTWYGFAREFLRLARARHPERSLARLIPITTAEYPTPARRPQNSRLNCKKLRERLGFTMAPWERATDEVMREVLTSAAV